MDQGGHRDRNASHGRVKQNWERGILPAFKERRGKSPQIEFLSERNIVEDVGLTQRRLQVVIVYLISVTSWYLIL